MKLTRTKNSHGSMHQLQYKADLSTKLHRGQVTLSQMYRSSAPAVSRRPLVVPARRRAGRGEAPEADLGIV